MRLWTLHPRYLDSQGLVALWREGLLAKAVLGGRTRGYRHHPQLTRFRSHPRPTAAINSYLAVVLAESMRRGYRFDARKIRGPKTTRRLTATRGQLDFEWRHLMRKLRRRAVGGYRRQVALRARQHPLFQITAGPVESWEAAQGARRTARLARVKGSRVSPAPSASGA